MKLLSCTIILSLLTTVCHATEIECYSGLQAIYKGTGKDVMYGDGYLFFEEESTGKTVYINGDCVVKINEIRKNYKDE